MKGITNIHLWIKILLLVCTILLVTEAGLKFFSNCKVSGIIYDKQLGWRLKKNYSREEKEKGPKQRVRKLNFNSRGFRDRDHSFEKDEGIKRIIFLGDSYTAGLQYSDEEIFTSCFEQILNANNSNKIKYEIMNVSIPAWATDQEYIYLRGEGIRYHPDYVLLMISPNDIRETYGKKFFYLENGQLGE